MYAAEAACLRGIQRQSRCAITGFTQRGGFFACSPPLIIFPAFANRNALNATGSKMSAVYSPAVPPCLTPVIFTKYTEPGLQCSNLPN